MTIVMEGIALDDPLRALIEGKLAGVLRRSRGRATSARVAFTDENGPKGGVDTRCAVTVDIPGRPAIHANAQAENPRLALDGALAALERELIRERQRRRDAARRPKKYFVAHQGMLPEGEPALPRPRRRRRSA
jgi:ribosome-associated translation inhibitor RaiA